MEKPKIELYVERTFSEKFTATFDFVSENWKVMFKYVTYFLLPLCLIQAQCMNTMMSGAMAAAMAGGNSAPVGLLMSYAVFFIVVCIGSVLMFAIVYSLMKLYGERADRLNALTWGDLRPTLMHNIRRALLAVAAIVVLALIGIAVSVLFAVVNVGLFFIFYLAFIAALLPLSLLLPIYLMEDISIIDAVAKTFRLGFKTWGGIFAISFVIGIIAYVMAMMVGLPFGICIGVKAALFTSAKSSSFLTTSAYTFIMYLFAIIQSYGMYLAYTLMAVALGYQYGHAAEKIDGVSVEHDIDNFEAMGDTNEDAPEILKPKNELDDFDNL